MKLGKFILPLIFVIGLVTYLSLFIVKEINQAIVLQFGDPKRIITTPGLSRRSYCI
jgi:membrane protease subunit HflC